MNTHRPLWQQGLVAFLGGCGVVLFGLELAFRALGLTVHYPTAPRTQTLIRSGAASDRAAHGFIPHSTVRTVYASNPRGVFDEGNGVDHILNSVGWRDGEHTLHKGRDTFRLLGLGDSYLWGQGVRRSEIVLERLGTKLRALLPETRLETINSGLFETNTVHHLESLEGAGLHYEPDLVILHFVLNDVELDPSDPHPTIEFFRNYTARYQEPDWLSVYSQLWGWSRQRYQQAIGARRFIAASIESFDEQSPGWLRCQEALRGILELTQERGVPFLLVIFPFFHELDGDYPFQKIHDVVREFAGREGIETLDLRDAYRAYGGPELWVHETDQHPNEQAHEIAADAIFEHLLAHPDLFPPLW